MTTESVAVGTITADDLKWLKKATTISAFHGAYEHWAPETTAYGEDRGNGELKISVEARIMDQDTTVTHAMRVHSTITDYQKLDEPCDRLYYAWASVQHYESYSPITLLAEIARVGDIIELQWVRHSSSPLMDEHGCFENKVYLVLVRGGGRNGSKIKHLGFQLRHELAFETKYEMIKRR